MANRNSTALTLPGNPLGSVLRETAREARRSTRDPNASQVATEEDLAALQSQVTTLQDTTAAQMEALRAQLPLGHAVILSDALGFGTWTYPTPNPSPSPAIPVVQATAIVNDNATVTLTVVNRTQCTFRVWRPATGTEYPNVYVSLTAFPSSIVP